MRSPRRLAALAASLIVAAPHFAWAQQLVTMNRGEGASVLPDGRTYRLGERAPERLPREVILQGSPIAAICCDRGGPACITERQVALNGSRADVLGRYGPPRTGGGPADLRYPGITFTMDAGGRVERICVDRR